MRWGFELTALDESLDFVGTLVPADSTLTQVTSSATRDYIKHRSLGTANGQANGNVFVFDWQAPAQDVGDITFYAAGNAANGNGNHQGDFIYTTSVTLPEPGASAMTTAALSGLAAASRLRRTRRIA